MTRTDLTRALTIALCDTRVIVSKFAIERLAHRLHELLDGKPPIGGLPPELDPPTTPEEP